MNKCDCGDRKSSIRAAAVELFARQGFQATSTAEVAKLAGVSEGSIFYHFQTKEGILLSIFEETMEEMISEVRRAMRGTPDGLAAVMAFLRVHIAMADRRAQESLIIVRDLPQSFNDPESPNYLRRKALFLTLLSLVSEAIRRGVADGSMLPCDPENQAFMLVGMAAGMGRMQLLGAAEVPDLRRDFVQFCLRALGSHSGKPAGRNHILE